MTFTEFLSHLPFSARRVQKDFDAALAAAKAATNDPQILQKVFAELPPEAHKIDGLVGGWVIRGLKEAAGPEAAESRHTPLAPAAASPEPRAAKPQRPTATASTTAAVVAELTAQNAAQQKTIGEQAARITALQGELATAKAGEAAAAKRAQDAEANVEARASARAQTILAAAGAPPITVVPSRGHPAGKARPGEGKTGLARMRAAVSEQLERERQSSIITP